MNDSWMDAKKEFGLPRTTDGRFTFDSVKGKELRELSPARREWLIEELRRQEKSRKYQEEVEKKLQEESRKTPILSPEELKKERERRRVENEKKYWEKQKSRFTPEERQSIMDRHNISPDDYREDPHYENPGKKESEEMWRQEYGLTDWDKIY